MPWPEQTITTRTLAGVVGSLFGAFSGFLWAVALAPLFHAEHPPLLTIVAVAAAAGFGTCFWLGDAGVRFVIRTLGVWKVR